MWKMWAVSSCDIKMSFLCGSLGVSWDMGDLMECVKYEKPYIPSVEGSKGNEPEFDNYLELTDL